MSKLGVVRINFLEMIVSVRWQNKKLWTSNGQTHHFTNNPWTNFLCEKSRNQLRGSCAPCERENSHIIACRKIWGTLSTKSLPLAQSHKIWRNSQFPASPWEGRKGLDHTSNFWIFQGTAQRTDFSLIWIWVWTGTLRRSQVGSHWEQRWWFGLAANFASMFITYIGL